jgi:uncharacterized protein YjbJ (UPF0337 family)
LFQNDTERIKEKAMSIINKDEVEGKYEQAKGTVKDKVGEITGNERLEAEGEAEHASGEAQETWGKFKRGVSDAVDSVGEAISDTGKKIND